MLFRCSSLLLVLLAFGPGAALIAQAGDYVPLDPSDPIEFTGDRVVYGGDTLVLGPRAFFVDGRLTAEQAATSPYVFASVQEAALRLTDGTEAEPMVLYLAPYVYWIDDPDDPAVRVPEPGSSVPYGLKVKCEWLKFHGLNKDPRNVVLASNRGQTIGAKGNFTMFRFEGDGTAAENVTFGNYCNVDLEYPLSPALRRKKRADAIVQAQLIHCDGDKIVARNVRFISRLNLCPFVGGKRTLFDRCHFESTDDALAGSAVYLNSTFVFFSSKPWYHTRGTGAVLLNCDVISYTGGEQYFTKADGQLAVIDTRFRSTSMTGLDWRDYPPAATRNYQYDVRWNGEPYSVGGPASENTVSMSGMPLLAAYRLEEQDSVVYNTYNLLRGDDEWDPAGVGAIVRKLEKERGQELTHIPVQLRVAAERTELETGRDSTELKVEFFRFGNYPADGEEVRWSVADVDTAVLQLLPIQEGRAVRVIPTNRTDTARIVVVTARSASGLEAAVALRVSPPTLPAPDFTSLPRIEIDENGYATVAYALEESDYQDASSVDWYRCRRADCPEPIKVSVSRDGIPLRRYRLTAADVGYFLSAEVSPRTSRSAGGMAKTAITGTAVTEDRVIDPTADVRTDFREQATDNQAGVIPGFWRFAPLVVPEMKEPPREGAAWTYGAGSGGSEGKTGLLQTGRTASLSYEPVAGAGRDMSARLSLSPFKTAGQGFSVAPLYLDVLVQYDPAQKTGYGLRIMRGTTYGNAVECFLVSYTNGTVKALTEAVAISSFRSPFSLEVAVRGAELTARGGTTADYPREAYPDSVGDTLELSATVAPGRRGGFGVEYNGGSSTMIDWVELRY